MFLRNQKDIYSRFRVVSKTYAIPLFRVCDLRLIRKDADSDVYVVILRVFLSVTMTVLPLFSLELFLSKLKLLPAMLHGLEEQIDKVPLPEKKDSGITKPGW